MFWMNRQTRESSMARTPDGRHTAPLLPQTGRSARFRWLVALGLGCVLLGAAVALDIGRRSADDVATASASLANRPVQSRVRTPAPSHDDWTRPTPGGSRWTSLAPAAAVSKAPPAPTRTPGPASAAPATPTAAPAPAPAPAPTASAAGPGLTPSPTAEYQTPTGTNQLAWSEAILKALGDPLTGANITSVGYWMQNEAGSPPSGIVGANNPINVSEPGYGGVPIKDEGPVYHLYSYPTVQDGIEALVAYLNPYSYSGILAALKSGAGLSSSSLAAEFSVYSGHGYSTVPDAWGLSQGVPLT
jgi:LPXTG-motif cell wall-anchored protein